MFANRVCFLALVLCIAGVASAQPAVTVDEAAPVAGTTESPAPTGDASPDDTPEQSPEDDATAGPSAGSDLDFSKSLTLSFDEGLDNAIQQQISVDLIDLDKLREAIQSRSSRETVRLTLEECILLALDQNVDIAIASLEPDKAAAKMYAARGEFDPMLSVQAQHLRASQSLSQQAVVFGGLSTTELWQTTTETSLQGKLHYGTLYGVSLTMNKEESTFGKYIEEWDGFLNFTLSQPLLRGFGKKYNTVRIRQAGQAREAAEAQLQLSLLSTLSEVVKAYWDLVGAVENLTVREDALANAERLLKINEARREIGTAADIDVLQAKAGVAMRQSELITARAQIDTAEDKLKLALYMKEGELFSTARVIPVDRPSLENPTIIPLEEIEDRTQTSIQLALENRPEIATANVEIANAELEVMRTRNEMLPQFDAFGTWGQGGRDHKPRNVFYGIRQGEDNAYTVGFQGSVALRNRAARGANLDARLSERQAEERMKKVEISLMANVHLAVRNVVTNQILLESNRQARNLQEANVIAEEKRLRLGVTTSWQVLKVQEDLTAAQVQELQATISLAKAVVDLRQAEGTLLDDLGIVYETPGEPLEATGYFESIRPRWE